MACVAAAHVTRILKGGGGRSRLLSFFKPVSPETKWRRCTPPAPTDDCLPGSVACLPLTSRIVLVRAGRPVVVWLLVGVALVLALVVVFFLILYA